MKYRRVGRSGLRVSEVVLGSWLTFGSSVDLERTSACVRAALEAGIQTFDTADVYARGEAERFLAAALEGVPRQDIVLASKCFWPMSDGPNDRGLSRKHVFESAEGSLRRLGTDYLDLFQCHRYDEQTPLEETVRAMEDLVSQGKILYWGVSVWPAARIEEAVDLSRQVGGGGPISNQPPYSLLERDIELEVLPACRRLGLGQIVFSPLAQGVLTGKYVGGRRPAGSRLADTQRNRFMSEYLDAAEEGRIERFVELAREAGTKPAVLALAACLARDGVDAVIVGATRPEQVIENAAASGWTPPADVLAELDRLFPVPA
jgi:aryl-alcohol dehydrogenase-like predicted oxidoreductase